MTFFQSIKTCFRKYADFKGRAMQSEFWWFQLFGLIMTVVLGRHISGNFWAAETIPLSRAFEIVTLLPLAAVTTRRLHDIGYSGWWQFPVFATYFPRLGWDIPVGPISNFIEMAAAFGLIYYTLMMLTLTKKGVSQANKYGPNPRLSDVTTVFD